MARNKFDISVEGIENILGALNQMPAELRKQGRAPFLRAADAVRDRARSTMPDRPLSRWYAGRGKNKRLRSGGVARLPLWTTKSAESRSITSKPGNTRSTLLAIITEKSGAAVVWDTAGKGSSSSTFVENLTRKHGPAPRGLYAAADAIGKREVQKAGEEAAQALIAITQQRINGGR